MNGQGIMKLLELAPKNVRDEIDLTSEDWENLNAFCRAEITALALFYACRSIANVTKAAPIIANLKIDACTIHSLISLVSSEEFAETSSIIEYEAKESASKKGRNAVNIRHQKEGSRHNQVKEGQAKILAEWKSGKYTTKTKCVDEEYEAAGISRKKAEEALRNQ